MYSIFKFLEKNKNKPIPLKYKLIYNIPVNEIDLTYNGNLDLYNSNIEYLPNNLIIKGNLHLSFSKIKELPNRLLVKGWLYIISTEIVELPNDLLVKGNLMCYHTPLSEKLRNDKSLIEKYKINIKKNIFFD